MATVLTERVSNTGKVAPGIFSGTPSLSVDMGLPSTSTKPSKFAIVQVSERSITFLSGSMVGVTSRVTPVFFLVEVGGYGHRLGEGAFALLKSRRVDELSDDFNGCFLSGFRGDVRGAQEIDPLGLVEPAHQRGEIAGEDGRRTKNRGSFRGSGPCEPRENLLKNTRNRRG